MLSDTLKEIRVVQALEALPGAVVGGAEDRGELTLEIDPARILEVCRFLRQSAGFTRLSGITAVDWYPLEPRFEVVYHLHSFEPDERLRLKCKAGGDTPLLDSVTPVWRAADWFEREVFDMFGVAFAGHPDLKRILMPADWEGHPLRKDFPVHGHKYGYQHD